MHYPHPRCVLSHWCFSPAAGGSSWGTRYPQLTSFHDDMKKGGLVVVEKTIHASLRGERAFLAAHYLVAAALFPTGLISELMEERVYRDLQGGSLHFQLAATYAAAFIAWRNEEVNLLLGERLLEDRGKFLLLEAAKDVSNIRADTRYGGACRNCGLRGQVAGALPACDWRVELVPGRNADVVG